MNDWIFCHKHNHTKEECVEQKRFEEVCHQLNATTFDDRNKQLRELSPVLSTFDQIIQLLDQTIDGKFLLKLKTKIEFNFKYFLTNK